MNLKLKELIRTILRLNSEDSLESLYGNYSACLRHLVGYLSQKDDSNRKALLAVLRNMAFNKHQDLVLFDFMVLETSFISSCRLAFISYEWATAMRFAREGTSVVYRSFGNVLWIAHHQPP